MRVKLYYCTGVTGPGKGCYACFLEPLPGHRIPNDVPEPNDGNAYIVELVNVPNGSKLVRVMDDNCVYLAVPKNDLFELIHARQVATYAHENMDGFSECHD